MIDYELSLVIRRRRDMNTVGKRFLWAVALGLLAACAARKEAMRPPPPKVGVVQARLAANREFVGVRFRMIGADRFDPETTETYLVDDSTGERFPVVRLQRIGRLAEFNAPGEKDVHFVMFRNVDGKLKPGSRVTVVVGAARQEQLLLE
jgi:hypothetical protein